MTIDPGTIAAYEASRKGIEQKPFRSACYAPYTSLYFNTNGDVIACCKNTTYVLGNVAHQSLEEIWRGKKAMAMRKALRDYRFGVGCEFCEWQIRGGQYDQVYATIFDPLPVHGADAEWPARMEFTVSNTCNLACIMCYGVLSSTIRAHREKLPPLPKVYDDRFFADLRRFLPHLKDAKFFGGEPFLAQENFRIWDLMIEDGVVIPCHVTTNGTQWNSKVERVLEALPCSISVSLDGATKATVEKIRVNADFDVVRANVEKFLAYTRRRGTVFTLTYCLMRQNWHEFGEYLRYGEELGVRVFINTVVDPTDCSLYTLPAEELAAIAHAMQSLDARAGYSRLPINGQVWVSAVQALHKNADELQRRRLEEHMRERRAKDPLARAWQLMAENRLPEAIEAVAGIDASHRPYYTRLLIEGVALRRLGRFAEARHRLDAAVSLNRRGSQAFAERAWLNLDEGRCDEALADAGQAWKNAEGAASADVIVGALAVLAQARSRAGDHEGALAAMAQALQAQPDAAHLHSSRAWILWRCGRRVEALAAAEQALALEPRHPDAQRLQGLAAQQT
jgi:radical SAM protein with 4Fe4S-binding SPASM domain